MEPAKQPERLCVGCREKHPKGELIRIVRAPSGDVSIDATGKSPGRGAYLCPREECLLAARKHNGLAWSFKGRVATAVYDALSEALRARTEG
ncbi:PF04296 family protein [Selenomonas sp. FOBRC9]|uniref:RNase P modulator RnpM n=1 Tax=Selenomonas sp. FOBRC9 TaxID=936573 RepID=UPI00027A4815|nr:YlxR family protein [Selenomonas sp. FOBRC9]EJP32195.1 PF04296 family protein [Selenomonas sp. FOBRC9]